MLPKHFFLLTLFALVTLSTIRKPDALAKEFNPGQETSKQLYLMCDIAVHNDAGEHNPIPRNYRALKEINASGSAQCSYEQFKFIKSQVLNQNVIVLDTREETHGFINGLPVSLYMLRNQANKNKEPEELLSIERKTFKTLTEETLDVFDLSIASQIKKNVDPSLFKKHSWKVGNTQTEQEVISQLGLEYARIHITDHLTPSDKAVEALFALFDKIKEEKLWLHVHCRAGKGRTTLILTAWDFYLNSHNTDLETIIKRQHTAGGINLSEEKTPDYITRYEFIKKLYNYTQARHENKKLSWPQWLRQHEQQVLLLAEIPPAA